MARIPKAKPCPFCGSRISFVERMQLSAYQRVCDDCFTHGPMVEHGDMDEDKMTAWATREWNKRRRATPTPKPSDV